MFPKTNLSFISKHPTAQNKEKVLKSYDFSTFGAARQI
jgi:hypothetical protein